VVSARGGGGEQARGKPGGAGGWTRASRTLPGSLTSCGAGRTAADRDAAARVMKEMPDSALSGSGGRRREKERR